MCCIRTGGKDAAYFQKLVRAAPNSGAWVQMDVKKTAPNDEPAAARFD